MENQRQSITVTEFMSQNKGLVFSWLLGNLMMIVGIVGVVIGLLNLVDATFPEDQWAAYVALGGFASFIVSWFVKIPLMVRKYRTRRATELRIAMEQMEAEEQRLDKIRKSMTPAEWEIYQVQLQNQRLLQDIKNKPGAVNSNAPRGMFGVVNDLGD